MPELWTVDKLRNQAETHTIAWCSQRMRYQLSTLLPCPLLAPFSALPADTERLIVCGGGTLLDASKLWRHANAPEVALIAMPTLWGSGAEVSPIAVRNEDGKKQIEMGEHLLPDARVYWPAVTETLPEERARHGCGDAWSHALEGFLSPLASEVLRRQIATLVNEMLTVPVGNDQRWFALSARACALQVESSVGLVHGIAHVVEGPLRQLYPHQDWGHAALCSLFLWPVLSYGCQQSDKWQHLMSEHHLDGAAILARVETLFDGPRYALALPLVEANWRTILRDPCSRTNSVLVRSKQLAFFQLFPQQASS